MLKISDIYTKTDIKNSFLIILFLILTNHRLDFFKYMFIYKNW